MAKRGRQAKHYKAAGGQIILGLRKDKKSGRFYPVGRGSPSFGTDEAPAIHRFRKWENEQGKRGGVEHKTPLSFGAQASIQAGNIEYETDLETLKNAWRREMRDLIYSNPSKAATELDCEPLALLANTKDLKPPPPSKRLSELCDTYLDDKSLSPKEASNSRTWWDEFQAITKAKVVTDLNRESFKTYRKTIKHRQGSRSSVWVRSRFAKLKTIAKHATIEMELTEREKRILSDVVLLKLPPKPTPRPVDISPQEMRAILSDANEWEEALILLALNAAYTPIDCQRLQWDMIDWANGTIRFDRTKSTALAREPLPRICSLWKRTIRSLKALENGHAHVFVSTQGQPAHIGTINGHFVKCCRRAGIEKELTFKHLRKSALTAASNDPKPPDRQVSLLAGHSAGIKEHYVVRKNVQLACEAIERYYFGRQKK